MKKSCFIIYSPLHAYIVDILIGYYMLENVDVYVPKMFNFKFIFAKNINIIKYNYGGSQVSTKDKFVYFLYNFIFIHNFTQYDTLYISNDADPFVMLLEKKIKYQNLNFIEEGVTYLSKIQYSMNSLKSGTSSLKKLFRLENHDIVLSSLKIKKAFVFFPEKLKLFRKDIDFIDLNILFKEGQFNSNIEVASKYIKPDILILTQPLTEDAHCTNNEEVKAILDVVHKNKDKKILIRLHYRDNVEKYKGILLNTNVVLMDKLLDVPYQVIHARINPKSIYTFISSVLFSVESINPNFKRVSMIDKIESDRAEVYYKLFQSLKRDYPDFYFSKEVS